MSKIRSKGSRPERRLQKLVRELTGERVRNNVGTLPGSPDAVVPSLRLAVMMEGCFWHRCPRHFRMPKSNVEFWEEKIRRNVRRDAKNRRLLREQGWTVWRVWEHDLRVADLPRARRNLRKRLRRLLDRAS